MSSPANGGLPPPTLPALRLTTNGECVLEEAPVPLDVPANSSGFSVSYASDAAKSVSWVAGASSSSTGGSEGVDGADEYDFPIVGAAGVGVLGEGVDMGDGVLAGGGEAAPYDFDVEVMKPARADGLMPMSNGILLSEVPPAATMSSTSTSRKSLSPPPRFSRATTMPMPLPSQLNQLQHPYRTPRSTSFVGTVNPASASSLSPVPEGSGEDATTPGGAQTPSSSSEGYDSPHVRELSYELADSIQMVVQTLLQISPAQVLDPGKEQFTACSLSVPTTSMSAMFTVMKNINYLSANMSSYLGEEGSGSGRRGVSRFPPGTPVDGSLPPLPPSPPLERIEFDIGETLQAIGDSLSGCAAQAGVDLVLYHGDVSLKHVSVYGDEASLRYAITQVIQQVLNTTDRGDSVELGLLLTPVSTPDSLPQQQQPPGLDPDDSSPSKEGGHPILPQAADIPLECTIRISHRFSTPERAENDPHGPEPQQTRPAPNLSTISIRQILRHTSGTLKSDLPPPATFPTGRTIELNFPLRRARSSFFPLSTGAFLSASPTVSSFAAASSRGRGEGETVQRDATLPHLIAFAETLKGKKVTLYASAKGCFAQHLTSYLTAWGTLVSHVTPEGAVDGVTDVPSVPLEPERPTGSNAALLALAGKLAHGKVNGIMYETDPRKAVSFIFIDDDVEILKERLHALRAEQLPASSFASMKRPQLANLHRPRSTNHVPHTQVPPRPPSPVVILHFTSLSNYKHLKETVQTIVSTYAGTSAPIPEVMIIPKPAGPRRLLAALFTAVTKPAVDPQFTPIATSPMSPGVTGGGTPFFFGPAPPPPPSTTSELASKPSNMSQPTSPGQRPTSSRTNSDRSVKSSETQPPIPPSPLAIPDNIEYFSAAAQKLGTTPSSGFMIQSPDGQPAGILFRPNLRNKTPGKAPSKAQPVPPSMERSKQPQATMPSLSRTGSNSRITTASGMLDFRALHEASNASSSGTNPQSAGPSESSPAGPSPLASPSTSGSTAAGALSTPGSGSAVTPTSEKAPSPVIAMTPSKAAAALASGSRPLPATATTRSSSMGPKAQSPPGSPQTDTRRNGAGMSRRSSQPGGSEGRESATPTAPAASGGASATSMPFKRGKVQESHIIPPISVLIVDDNPINQTILSTFMRKKKIKYDIANNGAEAVAKWKTGGFHLILMDIQMPIMDGIEATKEIRRLEKLNANAGFPQLTPTIEGQRTPSDVSTASDSRSAASPYRSSVIIVALTASSLQSDRVAALAAGCNDFLTKPVSLLWLNNKIIEWGSIKALQMWADLRPDVVRSMNTGQAQQAMAVADNLHMPRGALRKKTPSPKRSSSLKEEQDAAIALASPSGGGMIPQAVQKAIATAELNAAVQAEAAKMSASAAAAAQASASSSLSPLGMSRSNSRRSENFLSRRASASPEPQSTKGKEKEMEPEEEKETEATTTAAERLPPRVRRVSVELVDGSPKSDGARSTSPTPSAYFTPPTKTPTNASDPAEDEAIVVAADDDKEGQSKSTDATEPAEGEIGPNPVLENQQ